MISLRGKFKEACVFGCIGEDGYETSTTVEGFFFQVLFLFMNNYRDDMGVFLLIESGLHSFTFKLGIASSY